MNSATDHRNPSSKIAGDIDEGEYRFGPYRLDPAQGLFRGGVMVHLPPKELALLRLLLRANGAIVSVAQIENEVWPRQIVSYASVARCVCSLRKILGDDGRDYVATAPRRGYRFTQPAIRVPALGPEVSRRALAYYEEGMREASRSQGGAHARAISLFEEARRIAPEFLEPLVAIADCCVSQLNRGNLTPKEASRHGQEACNLALDLDPRLARALALKAWFRGLVDRSSDGLELIERALALDPGDYQCYAYYAYLLRAAGRQREAVVAARTAAELNPFLLLQIQTWTLFCAGMADEALASARDAQRRRPYMDVTNAFLSVLASWSGHHDEALKAGRLAATISNRNPTILCGLGYALARVGDHEAARDLADEIASSVRPRGARPHLAAVYSELDERERAFACLREAKSEGCPYFPGSLYDPRLAELMEHAQVRALYD